MAIEIRQTADFFVANEDDLRGNGNTGATALTKTRTASISPDIGYTDDLAAATDTGTSSLIALLKRLLTKFSTSAKAELITSNIDISGVLTSITVADSGSTAIAGQNSQSIITGTPTVGSFVAISPYGDSSFSAKVGGTFVGTLQFERTVDNVSWYPISADVAGTNYNTNQITAIGSFHGNASVSIGVRLRCLTLTSGSPSVQFTIGSGVNTIRVGNPLRLFDAVSGMVATIKAASILPVATDTAIVVDVRNYPLPITQTVPIAVGTSLSNGFAINSAFPVALNVSAPWTTANITFQGSLDGGITYANARTSGGSEITINVFAVGDTYTLNPLDFAAFTHLKIRSGVAATPINQVSAASLTLSTRGAL